jgi:DNA polymerase III epsilon subunit-like protein
VKRLMLDVESYSTRPDAALLQIGAVVIGENFNLGRGFLACINPSYAIGHHDPKAVAWWGDQDPAVRLRVLNGTDTPQKVAEDFAGWVRAVEVEEVWARGPQLDVCALEHLMRECNVEVPWKYSDVRDLRTMTAMFPLLGPERSGHHLPHDAYYDAHHQALVLVEILKHIERTEEMQL